MGAFCSRLERVSSLRPQRRPLEWVSELCSARRQGAIDWVAPRQGVQVPAEGEAGRASQSILYE